MEENLEDTKICGIAGVLGPLASRNSATVMLETIRHRGRDDQGIFDDREVVIGCNRLSIIDVPGGHQPLSNEQGTIWIAYNGEIYNHNELREELTRAGHSFTTRSDTEVIVNSYEEWGTACFARLNGMFALAIWDGEQKRLILARDKLGIKPLYYSSVNTNLVFASEYKAILSVGHVDLTINSNFVMQLVEVGYPLSPETLLSGVHQLPPGNYLVASGQGYVVQSYWAPPSLSDALPSIEGVRESLKQAIVSQTITSDVPVAAFLSGGLDTSTVVAFASKARSEALKTFCMGFGETTDEFADARLVAETIGTEHQEIQIDASEGMKLFPRMVWHSETPKVNLYTWFVNEAASKYAKVCLSGLGGDELFCGYPNTARFNLGRRVQSLQKLRALAPIAGVIPGRRAGFLSSLRSKPTAYTSILTGFPDREISNSVKDSVGPYFSGNEDFLQDMIRCEFHTKLPYDYLLVEDAMSMAHTLEVRVPFLDDRLLHLMLPVRYRHQMQGQIGKVLLREAMHGILPPQCFEKPKWGFSIDVYSWWRRGVRDYALEYIPVSSFLKKYAGEWYERVMHHIQQPTDPQRSRWYSMAWIMLGLEVWQRTFLQEQPKRFSW